ncbi:MAG TPA: Wzz/FepE/Etk N-terminal domain-containing protein [Gaiellaceae bacterium]|nr:Wzz/FepE/Etk N-terminal domain-containing protein [Gaiellaceae bacterium]
MTAPAPPSRGFDPEAEQEVDFAKYVRLLAIRWWLLAAGVVAGAVIGYLISLGGTQVYSATATLYLGQPLGASGNFLVQNPQTNPSAIGTTVHTDQVQLGVAAHCKAHVKDFRNGISTKTVKGALTKNGQTPLVQLTVQAKKAKVAQCATNGLANAAVKRLGTYADQKIATLKRQIAFDNKDISQIGDAIAGSSTATTDKLILETLLRQDQQDKIAATQLLLQAQQVEKPRVLVGAAAHKVTARSRRNTVVVAALIGLILGALAALLWDTVVPRLTPRNGD